MRKNPISSIVDYFMRLDSFKVKEGTSKPKCSLLGFSGYVGRLKTFSFHLFCFFVVTVLLGLCESPFELNGCFSAM